MSECLIELENGSIGRDLTARLATEIIKYLLYDRQQIPFPMTNSKSLVDLRQKSSEHQLSTKEEQVVAMFDDLETLFNEVICVLSLDAIDVQTVSLSLGQTLLLPKELYCIELPSNKIYEVRHCADCPKLTLRQAVTRFFKTILNDINILFQNRKDISSTKIFVLIKVNKRNIPQVMNHSFMCERLKNVKDREHFTPHMEYEIPRIGNRFKLSVTQKQCNCSYISDNSFEIFSDSYEQSVNDSRLDLDLSKHMSKSLTVENIGNNEDNASKDQFVWIQVLPSIKGIQYLPKSNKNIY